MKPDEADKLHTEAVVACVEAIKYLADQVGPAMSPTHEDDLRCAEAAKHFGEALESLTEADYTWLVGAVAEEEDQ